MNLDEVRHLPPVVGLDTAAQVLGMSYASAYRLLRQDKFPVPVLKLGKRYRVRTAHLMEWVGVDEAPHSLHIQVSTSNDGKASSGTVSGNVEPMTTKSGRVIVPDKTYKYKGRRVLGSQIIEERRRG